MVMAYLGEGAFRQRGSVWTDNLAGRPSGRVVRSTSQRGHGHHTQIRMRLFPGSYIGRSEATAG